MANHTFVVFYSANASRQTSNDRVFHSSQLLGLAVDALRPLPDTGSPVVDAIRPLRDTGGLAVDALRLPDMLCFSHSMSASRSRTACPIPIPTATELPVRQAQIVSGSRLLSSVEAL